MPSYEELSSKLQNILRTLEDPALPLGDMESKLEEAYNLLSELTDKLHKWEARITQEIQCRSPLLANKEEPSP